MKNRLHLSFFLAALLSAATAPPFVQANTLVVLNKSEATASLIDLEKGIVIHPSGKKAWVAHTNADVVVEIDLESWEIVRLLEAGREPDGMAYSTLEVKKH